MVHTALSSVLLLCIWEETRVKPECRDLRDKVIEAFSSLEFNVSNDQGTADGVDQNAMQGWNSADVEGQSGFIPDIDNNWNPFADYGNGFDPSVPYEPNGTNMDLPSMEISPMNYIDSIMRANLVAMSNSTGAEDANAPEAENYQHNDDNSATGSQATSETRECKCTCTGLSRTLHPSARRKRIVVAITGATGAILAIKILIALRRLNIESHLIISKWAEATIKYETDYTPKNVRALADHVHSIHDMAAPVSSGSFQTDGMIVVPCSMKTLAAISTGYCDELISRTADVMLKERRKLVLVARETPLSDIHLRNMLSVTQSGAIVFPPVPAYYIKAASIDSLADQTAGRILDLFGLDKANFERWEGWKKGP
ncbi:hypothetical protein PspLS_11793 [Pyricularia sp. CBS 133598]|nr:hypothetical protein PspLS_11793 [Pyricularia sp. CBS 133598]